MQRRAFLLTPLAGYVLCPAPGSAQAAGRLPPDPPGTEPRDDARFSAALLQGMAKGEEQVRAGLIGYQGPALRTVKRQVPQRGLGGVESHYTQVLAVERRWRDPYISMPRTSSSDPFLPPRGWTDGKGMLILMTGDPTRAENGLVPYVLLTNLEGG